MTYELYDWQEAHASKLAFALSKFNVALDSSDMGTGKTIIASVVASQLKLHPVVVCPKAVIPNWKKVIKGVFKLSYKETEPVVHNYEKLTNAKSIKKVQILERCPKDDFRWRLDRRNVVLIFDEVHKCKGDRSLNSKLLKSAVSQGFKILMLSATACHDPRDMKSIGFALGLHSYRDYWSWCLRNGCRKGWFGGLEFTGSPAVLSRLHDSIYTFGRKGSRIKISDLPEGAFPDNKIIAQSFLVDDSTEYDLECHDIGSVLSREFDEYEEEDNPLTILLRARQRAERQKVSSMVELIESARADGNSVAVFVNFKETLGELLESLPKEDISLVMGGQSDLERERNISNFQSNKTKVILCMIQAGGVGLSLHDEHGGHPRVSIVSPGYSAIELRQALGRIHRAGGQSRALQYVVFASDTVEDHVCEAVHAKLDKLDMLNDGDLTEPLTKNYEELMHKASTIIDRDFTEAYERESGSRKAS
jgi:superfamily II DNA or RNA helicase